MKSPSLSGVPVDDGLISMTGSPSRLSEPIDARESVVIRCSFPFFTSSTTSTSAPDERDFGHLADFDAGDADDRAGLQPLTSGNLVFSS